MINRSQTFKEIPLNIVGSSTFGRYPIISIEKTYNMFMSDGWMVPYSGYEIGIPASMFDNGKHGRGLHTSTKLNRLIAVIDNNVFLVNISFNQMQRKVVASQVIKIGTLQTSTGVVYIAENNKPQVCISDGTSIYIYDQTLTPSFQTITTSFIPGFIDFHDTYFLCAASADGFYSPPANNTWRLSDSNDGTMWPDDAAHIGLLQTKPDNTQATVRFPSKGNMIFVFGKTVTEPWFDVGYQLFPYQRNTSFNIDYGCLNPATIASIDELVVWLAVNEKAGPVIMYSDGGVPIPITTDGIDYFLANLQNPQDSQAFLMRQDGHIFYHINFYSDNVSLFCDFKDPKDIKFYHACDELGNYFIASEVAFFNNQYYFLSKNNGNLYTFDTIFTTYDGHEIPRIRTCKTIRNVKQEYFIANDLGFTIESGNTDYQEQNLGPIYLTTEDKFASPIHFITNKKFNSHDHDHKREDKREDDHKREHEKEIPITKGHVIDNGNDHHKNPECEVCDYLDVNKDCDECDNHHHHEEYDCNTYLITQDGKRLISEQYDFKNTYCAPPKKYITEGDTIFLVTQDGQFLITQDDNNLVAQQVDATSFSYLISQQANIVHTVPRVDLSISIDNGDHFSSYDAQYLPPIGQRKNKLAWWQLGACNEMVCQFRFWGLGRFVATDGVVNIRQ